MYEICRLIGESQITFNYVDAIACRQSSVYAPTTVWYEAVDTLYAAMALVAMHACAAVVCTAWSTHSDAVWQRMYSSICIITKLYRISGCTRLNIHAAKNVEVQANTQALIRCDQNTKRNSFHVL